MVLEIEMSHHEVAPGQHEIDFKYGPAIKQADNAITFKHVVKSIAQKHGLYATFMPKPLFGENGSGMHVHQSLFDIKTGKNAFYEANDNYKLSHVAKSFIAGQLSHVKAMSAVTAPKVNSYKRLVPGFEAPVYICWAQINRSALIRIPRYSPGREKATRAELRCPDPSCNPYLAFAVMLKAGLDGIKKKLTPPKPVEEDVYEFDEAKLDLHKIDTLPASLGEAIDELKKDKIIQEALGNHTYPIYVKAKKEEFDEFRLQVTKWELGKYFEST
jgi:glutamine synthetase